MTNLVLKSTFSLVVIVSIFTGCGNKPVPQTQKQAAAQEEVDFRCKQDGVLAPKWTCDPYVEGAIAAIGIAKMNAGKDKSLQRSEAMSDGRDALAAQISIKVSNLFKSYKGTTGSGDAATFDASNSKVSKQLASETLAGSKSIDSWTSPKTGELYLLVTISNTPVKEKVEEAIKTSFGNDQAMYQKFIAAKAGAELDAELSKVGK
ncbi:MAG: LPP20 family lipoprotein [Epsilonproteobacteria bacterium]|nr:LPP20 family lipoprotein [Campylobacterota bacterium]